MCILLPKPIDQLGCNDRASASERTKAQENFLRGTLRGRSILCPGQNAPSKFRENPASGFTFPSCQFFGGLQNIIINVKGGSHASDDNASEFHDQ
jgi:hypothetical protein